jgi:hypothetical protein
MSLACSPFISSISAMSFGRGSSLTFLCLYCSLQLQSKYNNFRNRLEWSIPLLDEPTLPTIDDENINAAPKVLRMERERVAVEEAEKDEDRDEMGDGIRTSATDQDEGTVDEAGQPQAPVDKVGNALELLVHNATEESGFAPRDVYYGAFELPRGRNRNAVALENLNCPGLRSVVRRFSVDCWLVCGSSRDALVVYPCPSTSLVNLDDWAIDFKSIRIARDVVELMRLQGEEHLWEMYKFFHNNLESVTSAGRVFEAIVHRTFSDG